MRKVTVLSSDSNRGIFAPNYELHESENITKAVVKNTTRAVRKIKRIMQGETVIITYGNEISKSLVGSAVKYENYSYRRIIPVLKKICRQAALKYKKEIPFEDFYIMASPSIACEIIDFVYNLSRIFTVISDEETAPGIYDELYFKYGTLIRQIPTFNNNIAVDAIVIRCDAGAYPTWAEIPVIDMSPAPISSNLCVNAGEIYVYDERVSELCRAWGGCSGLNLYELLDEYPSSDSGVNINKTADEIFLLDTREF